MRMVVVVTVCALGAAVAGCGSGRHVTSSTSYQTCGLSVPLPPGFHHRFWNFDGGEGLTIGDGTRGLTDPAGWVDDPSRVTLAVYSPATAPRRLQFPVTLHELEQGSGGIPFWEGGGAMGDHNESCGVAVWLGPNASAADRSAVLSVLQAIKPS